VLRRLTIAGGALLSLVASAALLLSLAVLMLVPDGSAGHGDRAAAPQPQTPTEAAPPAPGKARKPAPPTPPAPSHAKPTKPAEAARPGRSATAGPSSRSTSKPSPARRPGTGAAPATSPVARPGATATPPTPATTPPSSTPPPPTAPVPPSTPARQLQFVPSADPLLCDASERVAGTLHGTDSGERIRLTSPDFDRPILLSADAEGVATVMWSCTPDAARTVAVTAWGADGRRDISFPVTGVGEPGAPSVAEIDAQSRVDAAADLVLDAVEAEPDTGPDSGFAGIVVSPGQGEVGLYWKGTVPAAVAEAVDRAHATTGIRVAVRPAEFTRRHLLDRADVLVAVDAPPLPPTVAPIAEGIYRVAVLPEGAGLEVGIARPAGLDAGGVARWVRAARTRLEAALGVPVHLVVDGPPMHLSRAADSSPWLGGARIVGESVCSSGFGVRAVGAGSATPFGLLTAAHCRGDSRGRFHNGDRNRVIGPDDRSGPSASDLDTRRIPVDEAGARIHSGGVGDAEFTRPVRRAGRNVKGDQVCTSGAATGAHCGLVIENVDSYYRPAGSTTWSRVVEATSTGVAAGQGDSGGPVFTLTEDGGVEARGTVAGGSRNVACGRYHLGACTADVFFVDIERALEHHRSELLTSDDRA
jgi:hypothetical protein